MEKVKGLHTKKEYHSKQRSENFTEDCFLHVKNASCRSAIIKGSCSPEKHNLLRHHFT